MQKEFKDRADIRRIKTARSLKAINNAVKEGFKPLVQKVKPNKELKNKYALVQVKSTGHFELMGDLRANLPMFETDELKTIIDWTEYYPYHQRCPYAAYLLPTDIKKGELVFLEDLIENIVESRWNQGDTYRLKSCEAIWNGKSMDIQFDPSNICEIIG